MLNNEAKASGIYTIECLDAQGNLKWSQETPNLVVNQGIQTMNATYFASSTQVATWYVGLITGPGSGVTIAAGNTLASHAGWTEFTNYTGTRKTAVFATATTANPSVVTNSASPASFIISGGGGTVAGAFLCSATSGTSGTLFSASNFQSPGDRIVVAGDTLNVTYTFSLTAS